MDVQRLLILDVREQIYFMKGKSMGLNKDEYIWLFEFRRNTLNKYEGKRTLIIGNIKYINLNGL